MFLKDSVKGFSCIITDGDADSKRGEYQFKKSDFSSKNGIFVHHKSQMPSPRQRQLVSALVLVRTDD